MYRHVEIMLNKAPAIVHQFPFIGFKNCHPVVAKERHGIEYYAVGIGRSDVLH